MGYGSSTVEKLGMSDFWQGRRVLVTGHTGFKGSWLSLWLSLMGAEVHGLALAPETEPNLFDMLDLASRMNHAVGDIRDPAVVDERIRDVKPDIVFHLAAQPLVLRSYQAPVETWETNVGGTLHLLDSLRRAETPATLIVVTTDKVYENKEWDHPYRETDRLGGHDLYSSSKAATEILVHSWRSSYAAEAKLRIASARAGNVIGGGDFAENRIVPDIVRALQAGQAIEVRNPSAVRPWQHVLEPLSGYLRLAEKLHDDIGYAKAFNFGPAAGDFRSVGDLVLEATKVWPGEWRDASDLLAHHEAGLLAVASDLARLHLGWSPRWDFEAAIDRTISWYRAVDSGTPPVELCMAQIAEFRSA